MPFFAKTQAERDNAFREKCRAVRLPLTVQRLAVFGVLAGTTEHPSADRVFEMVRRKLPRLSRTSVFRILDAFVEKGLVRKIETPGSAARYDGNPTRHCHTICLGCGEIGDWFDSPFDCLACPDETPNGFSVRDFSFTVLGLCARCREKEERGSPTEGAGAAKVMEVAEVAGAAEVMEVTEVAGADEVMEADEITEADEVAEVVVKKKEKRR